MPHRTTRKSPTKPNHPRLQRRGGATGLPSLVEAIRSKKLTPAKNSVEVAQYIESLSEEIERCDGHIKAFELELDRHELTCEDATESEIDRYVCELNIEATESKMEKVKDALRKLENKRLLQTHCKISRPDNELADLVELVMTIDGDIDGFVNSLYMIANCWDDGDWAVVDAGMSTRIISWCDLYEQIDGNIARNIVEDLTRCYLGLYSGQRPAVHDLLRT